MRNPAKGVAPSPVYPSVVAIEKGAFWLPLNTGASLYDWSKPLLIKRGKISTQNSSSLKLVDKFTYLRSSVSSTETDINTRLAKAWTAINRLSVIWKSDLTDKMKCSFFQAAVVSVLLYGCTTWMLSKRIEKKEKAWRQLHKNAANNIEQVLEAAPHKTAAAVRHLPPIMKTIQVRWTRHAGYCWKSREWTHKWRTPVNPLTWTSKGRTSSLDLHTTALCQYRM